MDDAASPSPPPAKALSLIPERCFQGPECKGSQEKEYDGGWLSEREFPNRNHGDTCTVARVARSPVPNST